MRKTATAVLISAGFFPPLTHAAGYNSWAVPTLVEQVSGGLLIQGAFGDPHNFGKPDYVFISATNNSRFKEIVGMAYMALATGRELRFYSNTCTQVGFHWSGNVINENRDSQAAMMR